MKHGAMNYTLCGRKRKTNAWKAPKQKKMEDYTWSTPAQSDAFRRETKEYPSASANLVALPIEDTSYKVEESKKFTVAPSYNKGAYQVIPKGDVKWIGR